MGPCYSHDGPRSCRKVDADISSTSVLNASANRTAMDEYIEREVTSPYNIQIYYRYTESEIGRNWVTSPANEYNSLQFVNVLKYLFLEPYTEVMGVDFVRRFTPQAFVLTGLLAYNPPPSNSNTRASTVNGVKIIFMNINSFDFPSLKQYYHTLDSLKTVLETDTSVQAEYDQWKTWLDGQNSTYLERLRTSTSVRCTTRQRIPSTRESSPRRTSTRSPHSTTVRPTGSLAGRVKGRSPSSMASSPTMPARSLTEDFAELFGTMSSSVPMSGKPSSSLLT